MSENSLFRRTDLAYESCADSEIRGQNGIVKNEKAVLDAIEALKNESEKILKIYEIN